MALPENRVTRFSPFSHLNGVYDLSNENFVSEDKTVLNTELQPDEELEPLLGMVTIQQGIDWLVQEILPNLLDDDTVIFYNKHGAIPFFELLQKALPNLQAFPLHVTTSNGDATFSRVVNEEKVEWPEAALYQNKKRIIVLEDLADTGLTLEYIFNRFQNEAHLPEVITIALFQKLVETCQHVPDYVIFQVRDEFLVGGAETLDAGKNRLRRLKNLWGLVKKKISSPAPVHAT